MTTETEIKKGEVEFEADGKKYTLSYSVNALCALEDEVGQGIVGILGEVQAWEQEPVSIRLKLLRAMLWAGLQDRHPEVDVKKAGEILTSIGDIAGASNLVGDALAAAFPTDEVIENTNG